jgi:hypothetical protein
MMKMLSSLPATCGTVCKSVNIFRFRNRRIAPEALACLRRGACPPQGFRMRGYAQAGVGGYINGGPTGFAVGIHFSGSFVWVYAQIFLTKENFFIYLLF